MKRRKVGKVKPFKSTCPAERDVDGWQLSLAKGGVVNHA